MCVTSMVITEGQRLWDSQPFTYWPNISIKQPEPDIETLQKWLKLLVQAKDFDVAVKQPDCEDPKKVEFVKGLVERLNKMGVEFIQIAKDIEDAFK